MAYTNAAVIVSEDYQDTEDLDGLFSGFDPETRTYDPESWQYAGAGASDDDGEEQDHATQRETASALQHESHGSGEQSDPERDETLQHPNCVYQILKRHFSRYTPEAGVTHLRRLDRSLPRGGSGLHRELRPRPHHGARLQRRLDPAQRGRAVHPHRRDPAAAARQHGSPGGGIMALRGHASIQGSTDIPTLFNLLPGYLPMPTAGAGRQPRRLDRGDQPTRVEGLLGHRTLLRGEPAQGLLGRRRNRRERLLLRLPAQDHR